MTKPVRVTVTGAAGQISYSLLFRIAAGEMLGPNQPVILQMLEITPALEALKGVAMELDDCAFPLLAGMVCTDKADVAFKDSDYALLVGAVTTLLKLYSKPSRPNHPRTLFHIVVRSSVILNLVSAKLNQPVTDVQTLFAMSRIL